MDFPLFPLILIIVLVAAAYFGYLEEQKKQEAWKQFAVSHNLTFVAGGFPFGKTRVYGHYRGHRLELSAFNQNKQTYTRLSLYPNTSNHKKAQANPAKQTGLTAQAISKMLAPNGLVRPISVKVGACGAPLTYQQTGIMTDTQNLARCFNFMSDIADYYQDVLVLEGEAVPALQAIAGEDAHPLQTVAVQLLKDISHRTSRFSYQFDRFLCPYCLTRFGKHQIQLHWWQSISYYGCRTCGQSREVLPNDGWAVAVLNSQMTTERLEQDKIVRVNWLARRSLFDFDEIEIIQATDEEVERFAVQVGNDTDPVRKPRYGQMRCRISAGCHLSENTRRILQRLFGKVVEQRREVGDEISAGDDQDDIELDLSPLSKNSTTSLG